MLSFSCVSQDVWGAGSLHNFNFSSKKGEKDAEAETDVGVALDVGTEITGLRFHDLQAC